jgi:hypothetical protein
MPFLGESAAQIQLPTPDETDVLQVTDLDICSAIRCMNRLQERRGPRGLRSHSIVALLTQTSSQQAMSLLVSIRK